MTVPEGPSHVLRPCSARGRARLCCFVASAVSHSEGGRGLQKRVNGGKGNKLCFRGQVMGNTGKKTVRHLRLKSRSRRLFISWLLSKSEGHQQDPGRLLKLSRGPSPPCPHRAGGFTHSHPGKELQDAAADGGEGADGQKLKRLPKSGVWAPREMRCARVELGTYIVTESYSLGLDFCGWGRMAHPVMGESLITQVRRGSLFTSGKRTLAKTKKYLICR